MNHLSSYSRLALLATILALIVVMLGAYTRLSDAGLGCPDWPGCYGHLTVPQTPAALDRVSQTFPGQTVEAPKAWKEMIHRYFAGTLGILIVILAGWALLRRRKHPAQPITIPLLLVALVIFQAALGAWTVTWKVLPLVVSMHLLGGIALVALLWYLSLTSRVLREPQDRSLREPQDRSLRKPQDKPAAKFKPWAILALLVLIVQLFLGAWTSTNYAALACHDFPFCHGQLLPPMGFAAAFDFSHPIGVNYEGGVLDNTARVTIQMMHRYWAAVTAIVVGLLSIFLLFSRSEQNLRCIGGSILIILCLQIALGISNVIWMLPLPIAVMHNGVAAVLLLALLTLIYKLQVRSS